tara:strand:+ start:122 stop:415 length:294 start_codon:yes stop_codon:yes gene_type:complete
MKKRTMNELRQTKEYYVHKEKILEQRKLDQEEYDEALRMCTTAIIDRLGILDDIAFEELMDQGYCPDWVDEDQLSSLKDEIVQCTLINLQNGYRNIL